jgi:hypothetical protein
MGRAQSIGIGLTAFQVEYSRSGSGFGNGHAPQPNDSPLLSDLEGLFFAPVKRCAAAAKISRSAARGSELILRGCSERMPGLLTH